MSKPKKPAEDKSKAGAVTNSLSDKIDEVLRQEFAVNFGGDFMYSELQKEYRLKPDVRYFTLPDDFKATLKSALLKIIADRERKARIDELRQIKLKIDCVWVHKDDIRYALQITDILEGPNGVIIEGSL